MPPLMVVAIVALVTSRKWSIYSTQVENKFSTKAHLWEMNPNTLRRVSIGDAMRGVYGRSAIVPPGLPLATLVARARDSGENDLLVRNDHDELVGLLSLSDLGDLGDNEDLVTLVVATDLINRRTRFAVPQDNLIQALEFFGESEFDKLPILESADEKSRLLGYVRYQDILGFYRKEHDALEDQQQSGPAG